jgi:hypothetical protein
MNITSTSKLAPLAAVALLAGSATQAANLVVNGGFESPVVPTGALYLLNTAPTGWTGTGDIVAQGYFGSVPSGDGNQWLDLNPGFSAGTGMAQSVSLTGGTTYDFSFIYNGDGGAAGTTGIAYSISDAGGSLLAGSVATGAMNVYGGTPWALYSGSFTALADTVATLKFTPNGSWAGGFIDAVSLTAVVVPEVPHTGLALAGMTLLWAGVRRRLRRSA